MQNKEKVFGEVEINKAERGYSESQQALDIEVRSGDLQSLKRDKAFQKLSATMKLCTAYKTITKKLVELIDMYAQLSERHPHRAQKLIEEIAEIKGFQEILFTELVGVCAAKNTTEAIQKSIHDVLK